MPSKRLVQLHSVPISHVVHKVNLGLRKLKLTSNRNLPIQGTEQCHDSLGLDQVCLSPKPDPQLAPLTRKTSAFLLGLEKLYLSPLSYDSHCAVELCLHMRHIYFSMVHHLEILNLLNKLCKT